MYSEHISAEVIIFLILYGMTGVVSLIAAIYLLFRRGNAFAHEVTPPMRLRRWAAAFFAISALGHVWWCLFYIFDNNINSASYVLLVVLDYILLLPAIAGTLLAMLQDRKRPIWPIFTAMIPIAALGGVLIGYTNELLMKIAIVYLMALYVIFFMYMVFAVHQYERWLNDNYADLENKKVWLSQVVMLVCMLAFILYALVDTDSILIYIMHITELLLFGLLLWRVETLPQLNSTSTEQACRMPDSEIEQEPDVPNQEQHQTANQINFDLSNIGQLLTEHCVKTQLYLQHDLSLQQLALTIGTNRSYLSKYFSRQGIAYNIYINNLRIDHFISLYKKIADAGQHFTVQKLSIDSGYRSYSTFSLAFKQRMGQSVTAWIRNENRHNESEPDK